MLNKQNLVIIKANNFRIYISLHKFIYEKGDNAMQISPLNWKQIFFIGNASPARLPVEITLAFLKI